MINIITELVWFLFTFFLMLICHEFGHLAILKITKTPYKFSWKRDFQFDFKAKSKEIYINILMFGIIIGIFPLLIFGNKFIYPIYTQNILLILYVWGCGWDIQQIMKIIRS